MFPFALDLTRFIIDTMNDQGRSERGHSHIAPQNVTYDKFWLPDPYLFLVLNVVKSFAGKDHDITGSMLRSAHKKPN
jgi:hypothetical protein